jgi:hypothetical protein
MTPPSKKIATLIVWTAGWAIAFILSAILFKGSWVKDWIQAALLIGADFLAIQITGIGPSALLSRVFESGDPSETICQKGARSAVQACHQCSVAESKHDVCSDRPPRYEH